MRVIAEGIPYAKLFLKYEVEEGERFHCPHCMTTMEVTREDRGLKPTLAGGDLHPNAQWIIRCPECSCEAHHIPNSIRIGVGDERSD